eukprot:755671-Hanusia_phi.AAC.8
MREAIDIACGYIGCECESPRQTSPSLPCTATCRRRTVMVDVASPRVASWLRRACVHSYHGRIPWRLVKVGMPCLTLRAG